MQTMHLTSTCVYMHTAAMGLPAPGASTDIKSSTPFDANDIFRGLSERIIITCMDSPSFLASRGVSL